MSPGLGGWCIASSMARPLAYQGSLPLEFYGTLSCLDKILQHTNNTLKTVLSTQADMHMMQGYATKGNVHKKFVENFSQYMGNPFHIVTNTKFN